MAKRCLIAAYYFPPSGGGGVQRISKLVKYLAQNGWQADVVCADEKNDSLGRDTTLLQDIPKKTSITRLPTPVSGNAQTTSLKPKFFLRWLSAFIYLPDSRRKFLTVLVPFLKKVLQEKSYDALIISIPPYSMALAVKQLAEAGTPVVLDMRDPWSRNPYKIYPTFLHRWWDARLEKEALSSVKHLVSAYEATLMPYKDSRQNKIVISNGYDEEDFENLKAETLEAGCFHLAFSGTFYSHLNHPRPLFKAIALLKKHQPELYRKLRFHHIGTAVYSLKKQARHYGIDDVLVEWGYQNHTRALQILAGMSAYCFILDSSQRDAGNTIGGKVYEYLRLAKPVLALVPAQGEAAKLIRECGAGVVLDSRESHSIADLLERWLREAPAYNGDVEAIQKYERGVLAQRYAAFLDKIIETDG